MHELGIPYSPLETYYAPAAEQPAATAEDGGWAFQQLQTGGTPDGQGLAPAAEQAASEWAFVELPAQAEQPSAAAAVLAPSRAGAAQAAIAAPQAGAPEAALYPEAAIAATPGPAAEAPPGLLFAPQPRGVPLGMVGLAPAAEAPQYAAAVAAPPQRRCWVQAATDFAGGDLLPTANTTCCLSAADCCNTCWGAPGCGAWTFRTLDVSAAAFGRQHCPVCVQRGSAAGAAPQAPPWRMLAWPTHTSVKLATRPCPPCAGHLLPQRTRWLGAHAAPARPHLWSHHSHHCREL